VKAGDVGGTSSTTYELLFNDLSVIMIKIAAQDEDAPTTYTVPVLIPPFTHVVLKMQSAIEDIAFNGHVTIVGRVYGV